MKTARSGSTAPVSASPHSRVSPPAATGRRRGTALEVCFWGVRGSIAVPGPSTVRYGGNTSCVEVRSGREIVVLDAGTGIRALGRQLVREFPRRGPQLWVLLTHTHWDHLQGFPFFAPAYQAGHRVRILGTHRARMRLTETLASAMKPSYFPVPLRKMPGNISIRELRGSTERLGSFRLRTAPIHHPGGGVAFRLERAGASMVYVPDHEVVEGGRQAEMDALMTGADLLIHDAQYTAAEYARRQGWGHSCIDRTVDAALRASVRRLVLFHHDPERTDAAVERLVDHARRRVRRAGSRMTVDAAREGWRLRIPVQPSRMATAAA